MCKFSQQSQMFGAGSASAMRAAPSTGVMHSRQPTSLYKDQNCLHVALGPCATRLSLTQMRKPRQHSPTCCEAPGLAGLRRHPDGSGWRVLHTGLGVARCSGAAVRATSHALVVSKQVSLGIVQRRRSAHAGAGAATV